jgi:WD40 domain-containing protein
MREVATGRLLTRHETDAIWRSVAFSRDGRILFVGMYGDAGQFFSTRDRRPADAPVRGQSQRLTSPAFTADGRTLAAASADGTVLLWDVARREPLGSPLTVAPDSFVTAAVGRDGAHLFRAPDRQTRHPSRALARGIAGPRVRDRRTRTNDSRMARRATAPAMPPSPRLSGRRMPAAADRGRDKRLQPGHRRAARTALQPIALQRSTSYAS